MGNYKFVSRIEYRVSREEKEVEKKEEKFTLTKEEHLYYKTCAPISMRTCSGEIDSKNPKFLTGTYLTNSDTGTIFMPALINSGIILFNT